ncbi:MAG TPA: prolyl oligopeptidase family serine peptidase [Pseudomonadales bacterium]|nr:prolyl oligopeptidase family serine peptidase [Pseudomonadales bacterium]
MSETPEAGNVGYELEPASGMADSLCIMLHGYGADGGDMLNVAAEMTQFLPNTHFIAPNGPEPCLTAPGFYQWYGMEGGSIGADVASEMLAPRINQYADEQLARLGLDNDRLILLGFSQGAGIMLEAALRREAPCAGVLIFTGSLRNRDKLGQMVCSRPPVMLIHGDEDDVVPPHTVTRNIADLAQQDVVCGYHFCMGLGHSLNEEGAMVGAMFAADCLYPQS